jgi:branched-chain amino acid transport system substrate-binding protein
MLRASKWRQTPVCGRGPCATPRRGSANRTARRIPSWPLAAALMVLAGCHQAPATTADGSSTIPTIVGLTQIDQNGAAVKAQPESTAANPAGDGEARCATVSLAIAAPLSGADAALGENIDEGGRLAVSLHNSANPHCQVQLTSFDTEGDAQKSTEVVPRIINDQPIIGVIGPGASGEVRATGALFEQAGLVAATPSATNATLARNGWRTFVRGLANDDVQGPSIANYLRNTLKSSKVCIVDDSSDYGLGLAQAVRRTLGGLADPRCSLEVKRGDKDFEAAVAQLHTAAPDSIFYGGYYTEAAELVAQLRNAGVTARFVAGDASNDPQFIRLAGESAEGAFLSCPCAPAAKPFMDMYTAKYGHPPGTYSAEAYDLATIMLKGIDSGHVTRAQLLAYVRSYRGQGVAREYQWTPAGELTNSAIWLYTVRSSKRSATP